MARKSIDFATFKKIQKMPLNTFNHWLADLCHAIYDDGYESATKDIMEDCVAELDEDRLLEILLSVKGIGRARAEEATRKIMSEGTYGNQAERDNEERQ